MKSTAKMLIAAIAISGTAGTAIAEDASLFSIPPPAMSYSGAATGGASIDMPASGVSSIYVAFVLPTHYYLNKSVKVRFYLTSSGACTATFKLGTMLRRRLGEPGYTTGSPVDGATMVGGDTVTFSAGGVMAIKTVSITKPLSAPFANMRFGDFISMRIDRLPDDPADNCPGGVTVSAAEVRHTLQAF